MFRMLELEPVSWHQSGGACWLIADCRRPPQQPPAGTAIIAQAQPAAASAAPGPHRSQPAAGRYAERALTSRTAATTPHHGCLTRAPATRSPRREAARTQHRLARTPQQHICIICQSIACVTTVTHCVCRRRRPRVQVLCTSHKTDLREIGLKMGAHSAPLGFRVR
jgi:hypothetical protein